MIRDVFSLFLPQVPGEIAVGDRLTDAEAMLLALAEGWRGVGRVSPNPAVGCVILSAENELLAKGFHSQLGAPHAEIAALSRLSGRHELERSGNSWDLSPVPHEKLRGARLFVTLEPCAHVGRTPSCAKTLATLPFAEVLYGAQDPNPLVSGKGREILEAAGIRCHLYREFADKKNLPELNLEIRELCEHFLVNFEQSRPFVTLKVAVSLDGVFTLNDGESQWITSEAARNFAHYFRGSHDAILVGRATLARDNASMTIRHPAFSDLHKKIVVIDRKGSLLDSSELKIFRLHAPENLVWAVDESYSGKPKVPVQLVRIPSSDTGISLAGLHDRLWQLGIRSVLVESGGKTLAAHLRAGLADRLLMFQAPIVIGADAGRVWTEGFGVESLDSAIKLEGVRRLQLGPDLLTTGILQFDPEARAMHLEGQA